MAAGFEDGRMESRAVQGISMEFWFWTVEKGLSDVDAVD